MAVEFKPLQLTEESVDELRATLGKKGGDGAYVGTIARGVGRRVADAMPDGISLNKLPRLSVDLALQIGEPLVSLGIEEGYRIRVGDLPDFRGDGSAAYIGEVVDAATEEARAAVETAYNEGGAE